jgi:hypothetical protein
MLSYFMRHAGQTNQLTKKAGVTITFYACIREVVGSNLAGTPAILVSFSHSSKLPGHDLQNHIRFGYHFHKGSLMFSTKRTVRDTLVASSPAVV